jgi:hypothetical protein
MPARLTVGFGLEVARPRPTLRLHPEAGTVFRPEDLGPPLLPDVIEGHPWSSGAGLGIPTG